MQLKMMSNVRRTDITARRQTGKLRERTFLRAPANSRFNIWLFIDQSMISLMINKVWSRLQDSSGFKQQGSTERPKTLLQLDDVWDFAGRGQLVHWKSCVTITDDGSRKAKVCWLRTAVVLYVHSDSLLAVHYCCSLDCRPDFDGWPAWNSYGRQRPNRACV